MSEPPVMRRGQGEPPVVVRRQPASAAAPNPAGPSGTAGSQKQGVFTTLINKRWVVLLTLFGATAAIGIPLIWRSKGIPSRREKWFWTVLVSLYTILIFWIFGKVMWWSYTNISESLGW